MSQPAPPRRIYPQRLQYAFVQVGEPEAEFKPSPSRLVVLIVFGLLLVAGGLALGLFGITEEESGAAVGGLLGVVLGAVLAGSMYSVWGEKILVCPGGLVRQRGRRVECCRWDDISEVVEKKGKDSYRLVPRKGGAWTLDANHTEQVKQLVQRIRDRAEKHSIPWKVESDKGE